MSVTANVIIVEGEQDFADSLQELFAAEEIISTVFASAESALREADFNSYCCALIDVHLPGISGIDLQKLLIVHNVQISIVAISGHATVRNVVLAFENGASHFFEKPVDPQELLRAVKEIVERESIRRRATAAHLKRLAMLTKREREVLALLLEDKTIKQIASLIDVSPSTVEKHRAKILVKFKESSVLGLAMKCMSVTSAHGPLPRTRSPT